MNYKSAWSGRVYDGPLEGEMRSEKRPYFEFVWAGPTYANIWKHHELPPVRISVERCVYRWSNPLRAWVFDPSALTNR